MISKLETSLKVGSYHLRMNSRPLIMGILNVTPDSFSDAGKYFSLAAALEQARRMVSEGADIIDVGGESSRPGSKSVPLEEEKNRVWPVVEALAGEGVPISVDTYKSAVAAGALLRGAVIVNDISAGNFDPKMTAVVAEHDAALVLMHLRGNPQNMQDNPVYQDLIPEIIAYWKDSRRKAVEAGVDQAKIILDPGIGFGKTLQHNLEILNRFGEFCALDQPLLIGTSRKSMLGAITGRPVGERLLGTAATIVYTVLRGANIVRVHDVGPIKDLLEVTKAMQQGGNYQLEN